MRDHQARESAELMAGINEACAAMNAVIEAIQTEREPYMKKMIFVRHIWCISAVVLMDGETEVRVLHRYCFPQVEPGEPVMVDTRRVYN